VCCISEAQVCKKSEIFCPYFSKKSGIKLGKIRKKSRVNTGCFGQSYTGLEKQTRKNFQLNNFSKVNNGDVPALSDFAKAGVFSRIST